MQCILSVPDYSALTTRLIEVSKPTGVTGGQINSNRTIFAQSLLVPAEILSTTDSSF